MERDYTRNTQQRFTRNDAAVDVPGRRSNTEALPPAQHDVAARGLYARPSPLASQAGPSADEEPAPTQVLPQSPLARPREAASTAVPGDAQPVANAKPDEPKHGKKPATKDAASPNASESHLDTTDAGTQDANEATHDAEPRIARAPRESGRGGKSSAKAKSESKQPKASAEPAAGIRHEVEQTAPANAALDRTTVGVGEVVTFTAPVAGAWTASASTKTATGNGTTFRWKAPDTAGTATIRYEQPGAPVQTFTMKVVAPTSISFKKTYDLPQQPAGAGMRTNLSFEPFTVSFHNVEWLEEPGPASNISGYFHEYQLTTGFDLYHHPEKAWTSMEGERNNGVDDLAYTGDKPKLGMLGFIPKRWYEGSYEWSIPNKYRVAGEGAGHVFETVTQRFHMAGGANAGAVTVTKGGATVTQRPDGVVEGTGSDNLQKFATVAEATTMMDYEGGTPASAVLVGLQRLATYRERDPGSYKNLVAAIRGYAPAPELYVAVRCTNTYSWLSKDSMSMTVTGHGSHTEAFELNTDKVKQFRVPFIDVIDPASFNSGSALSYLLEVEGHELTQSMAFPFNTLLTKTAMAASEGRYMITSYLANPK